MRKTFILDTSVLLYDAHSIHSFAGNDLILPLPVLEELDKFKGRPGLLGDNARYVNRFLDDMRQIVPDEKGYRLIEKYDMRYRFELSSEIHEKVPEGFDIGYNDNIIIGAAIYLQDKCEEVIVITKDINLRVKCDAVGVLVEDYLKDRVEEDIDDLCGWSTIELDPEDINDFYKEGEICKEIFEELKPNHYVVGKHGKQSLLAMSDGEGSIHELSKFRLENISVEPRGAEQHFAMDALLNPAIPLVTLTGLAGSGKTFLALMCALHQCTFGISRAEGEITLGDMMPEEYLSGYKRLVITRTLQQVGTKDLGYLPGTMEEKMAPWLMPILDNVRNAFGDTKYFEKMMAEGDVEVAPIPYIRGRTFQDCILIVDEAQNATIHELKTIITRMGQNSKIILLGDVDQIDTPYIDRQSNGLSIVIDKFQNSKLAAHINLKRGNRSGLATIASNIL